MFQEQSRLFKDLQEVEIFHFNLLFFFFFFTGGTREEWQSVARGGASVSWSCMCSVEHIKCVTCMNVSPLLPREVCHSLDPPTGQVYFIIISPKCTFPRRYVTRSRATRYCASDATSVKRVKKAGEAVGAAARIEADGVCSVRRHSGETGAASVKSLCS